MESVIKVFTNTFSRKKKVKKIVLGICAMDKKATSKPMQELLKRLPENLFEHVIFGDECILNTPVEKWPVVDALIAFYSTRFPTEKALQYVKLRNPFMINDLEMESVLKDRRKVYKLLQEQGIDVPKHVIVNRDDPNISNNVEEFDEYIVVNGVQINKPLVEKPVDAEDHNIYIYYPMSAGGGSKRLFRKVDDRSSEFYPHDNELRRQGSFIYEEFLTTQGTDVKVYTVGPDYAHAEARKSPVVDGKVNRDSGGLEVRYPVILSQTEKEFARKIVNAFKQRVCGFDILRVPGKSYVCDVNGFSFVKNSRKYYDDASQVLIELMLANLRPELYAIPSTRAPLIRIPTTETVPSRRASPSPMADTDSYAGDDRAGSPALFGDSSENGEKKRDQEELRCVIAVIRHGDRTPKQKMKIKIKIQKYLDYFHSYTSSPHKDLKVKSKSALLNFLEVTRQIISEHNLSDDENVYRKLRQMRDVLERWEISGINRKLQMKPQKWEDESEHAKATEVLLILKWGGDLTPLGREQAELVGTKFRHDVYPDQQGGGVLRLHSTYRHDLKIKASDEGRVMKTAAAFTKGLLELEGQLTPILASLVTIEEKNRQMLDRGGNLSVKDDTDRCKERLNMLQVNEVLTEEQIDEIAPECSVAVRRAIRSLGNPLQTLTRIHTLIGLLCDHIRVMIVENGYSTDCPSVCNTPKRNFTPSSTLSLEDLECAVAPTALHMGPGDGSESAAALDTSYDANTATLATTTTTTTTTNDNTSAIELSAENSINASSIHSDTLERALLKRASSEQSIENLYLSETFALMLDRWEKLYKDFYNESKKQFDLTKVPDVYDMIRYDCLHNSHLNIPFMEELFNLAGAFENVVVPQEYGSDKKDKRSIGSKMCGALLEKIRYDLIASQSDIRVDSDFTLDHAHAADLDINTLGRHVRTRLYFTSESHIHTLLNVLKYPAEGKPCAFSPEGIALLDDIPELSYLTHIVFRLFENRDDPNMFRCEIMLSAGATGCPWNGKKNEIAPYIKLNKAISFADMIACLDAAISAEKEGEIGALDHSGVDLPIPTTILSGSEMDSSSPMSSRSPGKADCIVISNPQLDTSDRWEFSLLSLVGKKEKKNKDKKDKDKEKDKEKEKSTTAVLSEDSSKKGDSNDD